MTDDLSNEKKKDNKNHKTKQETLYKAMVKTLDNDDEWLRVVSEHGRMPIKTSSKRLDDKKKKSKKQKNNYQFDR